MPHRDRTRDCPDGASQGQQGKLDLIVPAGHVIDPRNGINALIDVAIAAGKSPKWPRGSTQRNLTETEYNR